MVDLIAKKSFTYATRRLAADDPFAARTSGDARALVALGKARYATTAAEAEAAPAKSARRKKAKAAK